MMMNKCECLGAYAEHSVLSGGGKLKAGSPLLHPKSRSCKYRYHIYMSRHCTCT